MVQIREMRRFVIAGTYAQYRDWLVLNKVSPLAAPFVSKPQDIACIEDNDELVLVGTYHDNKAYMSNPYRWYMSQKGWPELPIAAV